MLISLGARLTLVQQTAFPQEPDAPLGKALLLLQHMIDRNTVLKVKMGFVRTPEDILPFVLVDHYLLHGLVRKEAGLISFQW